jgi:hypothetical protein
MFLVGLIELAGAVLLSLSLILPTFEWLVWCGAGLLGMTSLGALFFHFKFDKWQDGIPALMTLALSLCVLL